MCRGSVVQYCAVHCVDRLTILPEPLLQTPRTQIQLFLLSLPSDLLGYARSGQEALNGREWSRDRVKNLNIDTLIHTGGDVWLPLTKSSVKLFSSPITQV